MTSDQIEGGMTLIEMYVDLEAKNEALRLELAKVHGDAAKLRYAVEHWLQWYKSTHDLDHHTNVYARVRAASISREALAGSAGKDWVSPQLHTNAVEAMGQMAAEISRLHEQLRAAKAKQS